MKQLIFISLLLLVGCSSDSQEPKATSEIWKVYTQSDAYDLISEEFVKTTSRTNEFLFVQRKGDSFIFNECYWHRKSIGKYTDTGIRIWDTELSRFSDTWFRGRIDRFETNENFYFDRSLSLRKIGTGANLDMGELIIEGPVNVSENNFVCAANLDFPDIQWKSIVLKVPYSDSLLDFTFTYTDKLDTGFYELDSRDPDNPIITTHIGSSTEEFYSITGTNGIVPDEALINITEISDHYISGSVSFNALGGQPFFIKFSADLLPLEP